MKAFQRIVDWKVVSTRGVVMCAVTLLIFAFCMVRSAFGQNPIETPPERPIFDGLEAAYRSTGDQKIPSQAPQISSVILPASQVVFERYRSGNWEVFLSDNAGSFLRNLTNNSSIDADPRLNRGGTKVLFVSNRSGNFDIYSVNPSGTGTSRLTSATSHDLSPAWSWDGSKIAFVSYRLNNQADIYLMNANGSSVTRLTADPGYDGMPALSPDGRKIAFTSNRSGGYRVYTMNLDGTGLVQISYLPYSSHPVWSPDGSKIAFDADYDSDGFQELLVMDANGGNIQQLLDYPGNCDYYASGWSPDGSFLNVTQVYWIYDNQYQQWFWTNSLIEAIEPETLLHQSMVAGLNTETEWDADWQTLDLIAPNSGVQAIGSPAAAPLEVRWSGTDGGPAGLKNYDVQVAINGEPWQDWLKGTQATVDYYNGLAGHTYAFRSRARDFGGNVEAWPQIADTQATLENQKPVSSVLALPTRSANGALLRWNGADIGGSGRSYFDIQFRDIASGDWMDWRMNTTQTQSRFYMTPGHTAQLRARLTDRAGNQEDWPPGDGDTTTTFYAWEIAGIVTNFFGQISAGVETTLLPAVSGMEISGSQGQYSAHLLDDVPALTVNWQKTGYGSLPPTVLQSSGAVSQDVVLPPADDLLLDGHFEAAGFGDWASTGSLPPVITSDVRHSGARAVQMGSPVGGWGVIEQVASQNEYLGNPQLGQDQYGNLHLVWRQQTPLDYELFYSRRAPGQTWDAPLNISNGPASFSIEVLVEPDGRVHIVNSIQDIVYRQRTPEGAWLAPEVLPGIMHSAGKVELAITPGGEIHLVWQAINNDSNYDIFYARRSAGGGWSSPIVLSTSYRNDYGPDIAIDQIGRLHIAWSQEGSSLSSSHVFYIQGTLDGRWTSVQELSGVPARWPVMKIDTAGVLHILGSDWASNIIHFRRNLDGSFEAPYVFSAGRSQNLDILFDANGRMHLFWVNDESDTAYHLFTAYQDSDGSWTLLPELSSTAGVDTNQRVSLTRDRDGHLLASWVSNGAVYLREWEDASTGWKQAKLISPSETRARTVALAAGGPGMPGLCWSAKPDYGDYTISCQAGHAAAASEGVLERTIQLPGGDAARVLSFLYHLDDTISEGGTRFIAEIVQGASTTTLLSTTKETRGWQHAWYDLSAWPGQNITLRFRMEQAAASPLARAYLDEVTIGTAQPDLWVLLPGVSNSLPGEMMNLNILFGNHSPAAGSGTNLTLTLPPELTLVSASLPPTVSGNLLTWSIIDLPASSTGSVQVVLAVDGQAGMFSSLNYQAEIAAIAGELELANNQTVNQVDVAVKLHLPILMTR